MQTQQRWHSSARGEEAWVGAGAPHAALRLQRPATSPLCTHTRTLYMPHAPSVPSGSILMRAYPASPHPVPHEFLQGGVEWGGGGVSARDKGVCRSLRCGLSLCACLVLLHTHTHGHSLDDPVRVGWVGGVVAHHCHSVVNGGGAGAGVAVLGVLYAGVDGWGWGCEGCEGGRGG